MDTHSIEITIDNDAHSLWEEDNVQALFIKALETLEAYLIEKSVPFPKKATLSVLLSDDNEIQRLNFEFRGKNSPTNVLSFPEHFPDEYTNACLNDEEVFLGDLAFSYTTIKNEALQCKKLFDHHLIHLFIHGTLHLLGFNHIIDEEANIMEAHEINVLKALNIKNPYINDEENNDA